MAYRVTLTIISYNKQAAFVHSVINPVTAVQDRVNFSVTCKPLYSMLELQQ